jgi:hypothetical protein
MGWISVDCKPLAGCQNKEHVRSAGNHQRTIFYIHPNASPAYCNRRPRRSINNNRTALPLRIYFHRSSFLKCWLLVRRPQSEPGL